MDPQNWGFPCWAIPWVMLGVFHGSPKNEKTSIWGWLLPIRCKSAGGIFSTPGESSKYPDVGPTETTWQLEGRRKLRTPIDKPKLEKMEYELNLIVHWNFHEFSLDPPIMGCPKNGSSESWLNFVPLDLTIQTVPKRLERFVDFFRPGE